MRVLCAIAAVLLILASPVTWCLSYDFAVGAPVLGWLTMWLSMLLLVMGFGLAAAALTWEEPR